MFKLQRILVATDFSRHSQAALEYAAALAKPFQAEVVLCHVVEKPDFLSGFPPVSEGYLPPNLGDLQRQHAQKEGAAALQKAGVTHGRAVLPEGNPAVETVNTAKSEGADLLVVGTHGRSALTHLLLGSVAEKIVRTATCPVLTVRGVS